MNFFVLFWRSDRICDAYMQRSHNNLRQLAELIIFTKFMTLLPVFDNFNHWICILCDRWVPEYLFYHNKNIFYTHQNTLNTINDLNSWGKIYVTQPIFSIKAHRGLQATGRWWVGPGFRHSWGTHGSRDNSRTRALYLFVGWVSRLRASGPGNTRTVR